MLGHKLSKANENAMLTSVRTLTGQSPQPPQS